MLGNIVTVVHRVENTIAPIAATLKVVNGEGGDCVEDCRSRKSMTPVSRDASPAAAAAAATVVAW